MKKAMRNTMKKGLTLLMALVLTLSLLPVSALADTGTVTVRIVGEDSVILNNVSVNIADLAEVDLTTDAADESEGRNALDAVLYATLHNGYGWEAGEDPSYIISYSAEYGAYSLSKIVNVTPSGAYWGTLAVSSGGTYDGNALSSHALTAGDTYIVYYDKNTGRADNYGYQSYAWFAAEAVSCAAGSAAAAELKTTGYDESWNTVATALAEATVYTTGGGFDTPTAVGKTAADGTIDIVFGAAGTYTLSLSPADYTYSRCTVTVGDPVAALNGVTVAVTDAADALTAAALRVTDAAGNVYFPTSISSGTYGYNLADGDYLYSATADGYLPASGALTVTDGVASPAGISLTALTGSLVTVTTGDTNETVAVQTAAGAAVADASHAGGVWTYDLVDGDYTYTVSRSGYHSAFGAFTVAGAVQNLTTAALADTATAGADDWYAFRDYNDNMATGSWATPKGNWQAQEDWATSLGAVGDWGTLSASNIVRYDGYLYVATSHGLSKLKASDGMLLKTTPLGASTGYVLQAAYGGGKIFVTTAVGIDAFDALTMQRLWSVPISAWGDYMAATPILYDGGTNTIYVGDYGDGNLTLGTYGGYSAINADTGANIWTLWGGATDARYWAGAVLAGDSDDADSIGDYLVFGSDSGTLTSVKRTGADTDANGAIGAEEVSGTLSLTGEINSSVAYDGTHLYVATKAGYIYKISIDSATGALAVVSARQFTTGSTTSTPLVHGGRIYVGAANGFSAGWIYVLNNDETLSEAAKFECSGPVASSGLLTTAYSGSDSAAYVYFTLNSANSEILVLQDDGAAPFCEALFTPAHTQYCMNSLIADSAGTLYYVNDSGYVTAVSNSGTARNTVCRVTLNVTPASNGAANPVVSVTGAGTQVAAGTYYLAAGNYQYSVSLTGYDSVHDIAFTVSAEDVTAGNKALSVTLTETVIPEPDITVAFALQGFSTTPSTTVTLAPGSTVADVITAASGALGFSATGLSTGYISAVTYGGVTRTEFSTGSDSGWLYTVNGVSVSLGITAQAVEDGDSIILYYTVDYTDDPGSVNWIEKNKEEQVALQLGTDTLNVTGTQDGGNLTLTFKDEDIDTLIGSKDTTGRVNIDVSSQAGVDSVTLNKSVLSAISGAATGGTGAVTGATIRTGSAAVTLSPAALAGIVGQAGGDTVSVGAAAADKTALTEVQKQAVGANPVFDLSMRSGDTAITEFGGEVTVAIPYTPSVDQLASGFKVFYIDETGAPQEMAGAAYDPETGCVVFSTTHFSLYMIGYRPFADVHAGDWYYTAAYRCFDQGLFNGTSREAFSPGAQMTREMFVTVLYRLAGEPAVSGQAVFGDAGDISAWALDAVLWASGNEIVSGYPDGTFAPKGEVTREQMAQILCRYAAVAGDDVSGTDPAALAQFDDGTDTSGWARTALCWGVNAGIVNGNGDGTLNPQGAATRAQVAQIVTNFIAWSAQP